jgi:hypothetical protein
MKLPVANELEQLHPIIWDREAIPNDRILLEGQSGVQDQRARIRRQMEWHRAADARQIG